MSRRLWLGCSLSNEPDGRLARAQEALESVSIALPLLGRSCLSATCLLVTRSRPAELGRWGLLLSSADESGRLVKAALGLLAGRAERSPPLSRSRRSKQTFGRFVSALAALEPKGRAVGRHNHLKRKVVAVAVTVAVSAATAIRSAPKVRLFYASQGRQLNRTEPNRSGRLAALGMPQVGSGGRSKGRQVDQDQAASHQCSTGTTSVGPR